MTPAEHYTAAETAIAEAEHCADRNGTSDATTGYWLKRAHVHAMLANATDAWRTAQRPPSRIPHDVTEGGERP
jgi:hypothetical protein